MMFVKDRPFNSVIDVIYRSFREYVSFLHVGFCVHIQHAIAQGAAPVADPEDKSWAQKVCYVNDIFGNRIRLGSFVAMAS